MDPVTLVVTAVALGASAGLTDTASTLVKDAYAGLKRLLAARFGKVDVSPLEAKPDSKARQAVLDEDLREAGAGRDAELMDAARQVVDAVEAGSPESGAALGVDIARVKAAFLHAHDIDAAGTGVRATDSEFAGGITASNVRAGHSRDPGPSSR